MTGFGTADGRVGAARVTVEVRTVNHRFFSPSLKLPAPLARWESEVREALRQRVARGHVTLMARHERDAQEARGGLAIDEARFAGYVAQLRALAERHGIADTLDVATVLRLPDVITTDATPEPEGTAEELLAIVDRAGAALTAMREDEGRRLAVVLLERIAIVEAALARIAARAPERLTEQRDRLRTAVQELVENVKVDDQRLAQEIAILADRLDVNEELDRFRSHITAFRAALSDAGADQVGKRLGFLLQEMLREANTTGSKANDAAMLHDVVLVKEELERIREQVENVE
ncbi:YicC/YloC family endoribonuclease [Roseisolibacter agri]|nr:YicC/YloC family endoribonuclease [Roseisolibacter agri]